MNQTQFKKMLREETWATLLSNAWERTGCGSLYCTCGTPDKPDPITGKFVPIKRIKQKFFDAVERHGLDSEVAKRKWDNFVSTKNIPTEGTS